MQTPHTRAASSEEPSSTGVVLADGSETLPELLDPQRQAGELRYRTLADLLPSQVWTARPDGKLDYVNRHVSEYFGRSVTELLGDGWIDMLHPEDVARCGAAWSHALATGADYEVEFRLRRADGMYRWHIGRARAIHGAGGVIAQWVGVNTDVEDERRLARQNAELLAEAQREAVRRQAERASRRLEQMLAGISDAFAACDADWQLLFANEAARALATNVADDAETKQRDGVLWTFVPAGGSGNVREALTRAMRERITVTVEEAVPTPGGEPRWYELRAYPLPEGGLAVHARDVSARHAEEELRRRISDYAALRAEVGAIISQERDVDSMAQRTCEALVRHLRLSFARVWLADGDGLDLRASAGKYTHREGGHQRIRIGQLKIGRIASERQPLLTNDVLEDAHIADKEWARREGMVAFVGYPLLAGDELLGVIAAFATTSLPEHTTSAFGSVADALAHGLRRLRAEVELDARARDLARSNAELEQFAYVASHDLQEPLRMVASFNQLLARRYQGKLDKDADEFIAFSVEGVTRMRRLINDLLAYSRVGTRGAEFGPVSMQKAFEVAMSNLQVTIDEAHATVSASALPEVTGDEGQLVQLWQNLISNAVKFRGERPPAVVIDVTAGEDAFTFSVRDNGVGIEAQYFDRIFIIFQRLHPRESYPGTGIGLALCKKIVERHGGRIWVQSQPGEGTTVWFTLPRQPPTSMNRSRAR